MRRRGLTQTDREAWAHYARLVAPLPGTAALDPPAMVPPPVVPPPPRTLPPVMPVPSRVVAAAPRPSALVVGDTPGGVDRATWTRFRSGKLPSVRTLDLHGRTAQRAYAALDRFLHEAVADGVRCVEVITGRGSGEAGGVIRREFPLWMNLPHLRQMILGAAHPHALNPGSVRLLLRRSRAAHVNGP